MLWNMMSDYHQSYNRLRRHKQYVKQESLHGMSSDDTTNHHDETTTSSVINNGSFLSCTSLEILMLLCCCRTKSGTKRQNQKYFNYYFVRTKISILFCYGFMIATATVLVLSSLFTISPTVYSTESKTIHRRSNTTTILTRATTTRADSIQGGATSSEGTRRDVSKRVIHCHQLQTIDDITTCYKNMVRPLTSTTIGTKNCSLTSNTIRTWDDVHTCGIVGHVPYRTWSSHYNSLFGEPAYDDGSMRLLPKKISKIHILGERNSGTKFVRTEIDNCFGSGPVKKLKKKKNKININDITTPLELPDEQQQKQQFYYNIKVGRDFVRSKHFFQPISTMEDYRDRLLVVVVRDPIEWMSAMVEKPYHSPNHIAGFDPITGIVQPYTIHNWTKFVSEPWTMPYRTTNGKLVQSEYDRMYLQQLTNPQLSMEERDRLRYDRTVCREHFQFTQVSPCRYDFEVNPLQLPVESFRGYEPIYELRQYWSPSSNLQPYYDHLLQLRADKILNWIIEIPMVMLLGGVIVVRYEDLLRNGTESLLRRIATFLHHNQQDVTNTTTESDETLESVARLLFRDNENTNNNNYHPNAQQELEPVPDHCVPTPPQPERLGKRSIPDDYRQWIIENLNADIERLVGYVP